MSAGVIAANISWNEANRTNGTPAAAPYVSLTVRPTFMNPANSSPPIRPGMPRKFASGANASEKPIMTQTMLTIASPKKLCMIVDRTFLRRTSPP